MASDSKHPAKNNHQLDQSLDQTTDQTLQPSNDVESAQTPENGLASRYQPSEVEGPLYAWWEAKGYFKAEDRSTKIPYSIMLPPPNVTGSLHLGHALDQTIQDTLIRWKRMMGFNTLWMPGTDHAGIATQMVVERELKKEKLTRHQLGREKFLERVWQWKKRMVTASSSK